MGPEELLAQIRSLLDQYLQLGADTPVASDAAQFAQAIDSATGTSPDEGAAPPPDDIGAGAAPEEMPPLPPEGGGGGPQEALPPMAPDTPPSSFADASSMALDDMKKRKGKSY